MPAVVARCSLSIAATVACALLVAGCAPSVRVAWRCDEPAGISGMVLAGDTAVCCTGAAGRGRGFTILGLATADGTTRWQVPVADRRPPAVPVGPVSDGRTVLVFDHFGDCWAVDAAAGRLAWSATNPGAPASQQQRPSPDRAAAPQDRRQASTQLQVFRRSGALFGGHAYLCDRVTGVLECRDAQSGRKLWEVRPSQAPEPSVAADSRGAYVAGADGTVRSYDAGTGRERWVRKLGPRGCAVGGAALGNVFARATDLVALDGSRGGDVWRAPGQAYRAAWPGGRWMSVSPQGDRIYVLGGDGSLHCLSAAAGRPAWEWAETARPGSAWEAVHVVSSSRWVCVVLRDASTGDHEVLTLSSAGEKHTRLAMTHLAGGAGDTAVDEEHLYTVESGAITCWELR